MTGGRFSQKVELTFLAAGGLDGDQLATEKVITLNDDFTDALSDVPAILLTEEPFAVLVQEGKRSRYRRILRRLLRRRRLRAYDGGERLAGYQSVQRTKTDAQAGLAIVWDARKAPLVSGPHYQVLVEPDGAAMLPRGVLWIVVDHESWGRTVLATTHRPPWRYRHLWPAYDAALRTWASVRQARRLLVGLDANTRDLVGLAARIGLSPAGKGIDGVMGRGFLLRRPRRLRQRFSDHRPVAVDATSTDRKDAR